MNIAQSIDHIYRRACIDHGKTPTIKAICLHPETFRRLADEVRNSSRLSWYSDGKGPHYMGMAISTAPIPDNLIILQDEALNVVAAGLLPNREISGPANQPAKSEHADDAGSAASSC